MEPLIRVDLQRQISGTEPLVLELGCGRKKVAGRITVDKVDLPHVDIVADLEEGLMFLPDKCVDEIHCRSVLEHVDRFEFVLGEIVRVLKDDGRAYVFVPHFSNPYYYSDYTHRRFFGLYSFYYFVEPERQLKRKVPSFYSNCRLNIVSVRLVFRSPFRLRRMLKKAVGSVFNLHSFCQELYEELFCYVFPCDGIEVVFGPGQSVAHDVTKHELR